MCEIRIEDTMLGLARESHAGFVWTLICARVHGRERAHKHTGRFEHVSDVKRDCEHAVVFYDSLNDCALTAAVFVHVAPAHAA